jgi:prepilin-type N-terminal cleavage/methylation domain-containing protein
VIRATGRARGMTLVELLIAMALSLILVGTAAFVFIESQQIMSRVDARLKAAQSFRVTSTILDADGARIEPTACFNTATPPALQLRTIATGGAWFSLKRVDGTSPDQRRDTVRFVTNANLALVNAGVVQPPLNQTVLVTYQIKPGRGLVRSLDLLTVTGNPGNGMISAAIDNALLPNNQGATTPQSLDMDLAPNATGFAVRYLLNGVWLPPDAAGGATDTGAAFLNRMPSGLEFTVFIPETNKPDTTRLSLMRTIELLPPPP